MKQSDQSIDSKEKTASRDAGATRMHAGLLLLGSAVFGGIAVALWNRRTLAKMKNRSEKSDEKILPLEDDAIY